MRQLDPRIAALLAPRLQAPRVFQPTPFEMPSQAQREASVDAVSAPPRPAPAPAPAPTSRPGPPRKPSLWRALSSGLVDGGIAAGLGREEARVAALDAQDLAREEAIAEAARRRAIVQQAFPDDPMAQIAAESNWEEFGKQLSENFGVDIAAGGSTIMARGRQTVAPKVDQFDDRAGVTTMTADGPVTQYTDPRAPTFEELSQDQERRTKSLAQGGILVTTPNENGATPASPPAAPSTGTSRGLRNNNPLNIEDGAFTRAQPGYVAPEPGSGRFATFQTPEQGAAAADRLLGSYIQRGFNTPAKIVGRWAPASENGASTGNYTNYVARRLGIGPNDPVPPEKIPLLRQAMSEFENGQQQGSSRPAPPPSRVVAENPRAPGGRRLTPDEAQAQGLDPQRPWWMNADGKPEPIGGTAALRPIPAPVAAAITDHRSRISQIDEALAAVAAYPQGMGLANMVGDTIRQRTDPRGVDVRAAIANIGSMEIKDRSGAAVTISEQPRLKPFIPMPWDTDEAAIKKLRRLKIELERWNANIEGFYGPDQGYRGVPAPQAPATAPARRPAPPATRATPARPAQRPAAPAARPAAQAPARPRGVPADARWDPRTRQWGK